MTQRRHKVDWYKLVSIGLFLYFFVHICYGQGGKKVVYITNTGKKYHSSDCRYLKSSKLEIETEKAKERGYTPCSVCAPGNDAKSTESDKIDGTFPVKSNEAKETTVSRQCSSLTKAGLRCKRMTTNAGGKCWQHE